ncbi:MAG: IPT/TIG domain-containing protein [Ekhidna sp.]|nr:IPT/TIG domain-containing protein [Ekhidna sp.]
MIKKTNMYSLLIGAVLIRTLISCGKDDSPPPPKPTITAFAPQRGIVGATVTITGTNFSTTASENTVTFHDGIRAVVTGATATELTVTVPDEAETGAITVSVNGQSATSGAEFTVSNEVTPSPKPTITAFAPQRGIVGATVTITGTSFSTTASENTVTFHDGIQAVVTGATATELTVTVPDEAETGAITVSINGQSATSDVDFTVSNELTPSKGIFRKGDKIYVLNEEVMYNGKKIVLEKDSVLAEDPEQSIYHLLKKQDNVFYLIELTLPEAGGNAKSSTVLIGSNMMIQTIREVI